MIELTKVQRTRFEDILVQWQAAVDLRHRQAGFTHPSDKVRYQLGGKYARFDIGGSGAFMVEIITGTVHNIKGYGKVYKEKVVGNIYNPDFTGSVLVRDRFRNGHYSNNADGSVRS